jgi:hypothetical protein
MTPDRRRPPFVSIRFFPPNESLSYPTIPVVLDRPRPHRVPQTPHPALSHRERQNNLPRVPYSPARFSELCVPAPGFNPRRPHPAAPQPGAPPHQTHTPPCTANPSPHPLPQGEAEYHPTVSPIPQPALASFVYQPRVSTRGDHSPRRPNPRRRSPEHRLTKPIPLRVPQTPHPTLSHRERQNTIPPCPLFPSPLMNFNNLIR